MKVEQLGSGAILTGDDKILADYELVQLADELMTLHKFRDYNCEVAEITPIIYRDSQLHLRLLSHSVKVVYHRDNMSYVPSGDIYRLAQWLYASSTKIQENYYA